MDDLFNRIFTDGGIGCPTTGGMMIGNEGTGGTRLYCRW